MPAIAMDIITTHKNTDFDALASLMAATLIYPGATPILPRSVNPNLKGFLSIHKDLLNTRTSRGLDLDAVSRMVVVDTNRWERLEGFRSLRQRSGLDIHLWDHHGDNGNIDAGWCCREPIGATITLMIRELKARRILITPIQATLFLAGIYEDTGSLAFPSTTAEDAYAAAWLLDRKADLGVLNRFLRPAYGEKQKNLLYEMLRTARRTKVNGHSISINRQIVAGHVDRLAVVVRMYREILNVNAAFGIFSDPDHKRSMIIARSDVEALDVGAVMRGIGGGGHPGAGSAQVKNANPEAVEEMIISLIEGNQQASVQVSDLMSFPVVSVGSRTRMHQVAALLRDKGCTGLPVVDDGTLVGVISRRDFKRMRNEQGLELPVKAFMSQRVVTIEPGKSPMDAAKLMVRHDVGRLPVVEDGKLIGIITRSDAMMYFYDQLPD